MTEQQAYRYLLNRIRTIRAAGKDTRRGRGFDLDWQLGRFVDEFEKVLGPLLEPPTVSDPFNLVDPAQPRPVNPTEEGIASGPLPQEKPA